MSNFWQGKRVCVTGGAGFVGSHLVRLLAEAGARVHVLDNLSRTPEQRARLQHDLATYFTADTTEHRACRQAFWGCDAVFNLAAAVAGVIYNQSHNLEMFAENVALQTVPVAVAAELVVPHFLQVSSVCVYAPGYTDPCREEYGHFGQPVGANAGYSWAKRMGERAAVWADLPHVVIVRPSNIYGPGDYFDERAHVIPALIRKVIEDEEIVVNGTGHERREFLYVRDAAQGMMHALEHGRYGEVYNLGTEGATCVSMQALVEQIREMAGQERKAIRYTSDHDAGDRVRWSDTAKMDLLGWTFTTPLPEGLSETLAWYERERRERVRA